MQIQKKVIMYAYLEHEPSTKAHAADFLRPIQKAWAERESGTEESSEEDMSRRRQEHFTVLLGMRTKKSPHKTWLWMNAIFLYLHGEDDEPK